MHKRLTTATLLLLAASACGDPPTTLKSPDVRDFPSRGFRLENVHFTDWLPTPLTRAKSVLVLAGQGSANNHMTAMVTIEASRPAAAKDTLLQQAVGLAKDWGSSAAPTPIKLDGEDALHIQAPATGPDLHPVEGVVALRGGLLYLIMGGITPGKDCHPAIQEIVRGWKWEPLTDPSQHLDFFPQRQRALSGLALNFPRDMYIHPSDTPDRILDLELYNPLTNNGDFTAYIQLVPIPAGSTFTAMRDTFITNNNNAKTYETPLAFTPRHDDPNRLVTDFARNPTVSKSLPTGNAYVLWALYKLDPSHLILINFMSTSGDEKIRAKYQSAALAIVDSLEPAPK